MVAFIDAHRDAYGVEPICAVLPIAPSTYYDTARRDGPIRRGARPGRSAMTSCAAEIRRVWDENFQVYGPRKVWRQLRREGIGVARCTVARLMRGAGPAGRGAGQARPVTTTPATPAPRPPDLVERDFTATRPNQLWVADLTYVATGAASSTSPS